MHFVVLNVKVWSLIKIGKYMYFIRDTTAFVWQDLTLQMNNDCPSSLSYF